METIQLICMQLQHAIHLDVNQNIKLLSGEPIQILYTLPVDYAL